MTKRKILVVEPSLFRRDETYVLGPFPAWLAWLKAHWLVRRYPWGEIRVEGAGCVVTLGETVLWDGREPKAALPSGDPYRPTPEEI